MEIIIGILLFLINVIPAMLFIFVVAFLLEHRKMLKEIKEEKSRE
jgi:heme exporter protein D